MKTTTKLIFALLVTLFCAAPQIAVAGEYRAMDNGWFFKPYLGVEIEKFSVDYEDADLDKSLRDDFKNYNIHLGARVHKHLGIELGYSDSSTEKKTTDVYLSNPDYDGELIYDFDVQFKSWAFDLFGYLPLDEEERFELIATAGILRTKVDIDGVTTAVITKPLPFRKSISMRDDKWQIGWRVGGGFQYHLSDRWSARFLARHLNYGGDFDFKMWSFGVGVNFSF